MFSGGLRANIGKKRVNWYTVNRTFQEVNLKDMSMIYTSGKSNFYLIFEIKTLSKDRCRVTSFIVIICGHRST